LHLWVKSDHEERLLSEEIEGSGEFCFVWRLLAVCVVRSAEWRSAEWIRVPECRTSDRAMNNEIKRKQMNESHRKTRNPSHNQESIIKKEREREAV